MALSFTLISLVVATFFFLLDVSNAKVSVNETHFKAAVTSNGFPSPSSSTYKLFMKYLPTASITTNLEAAQYLAQVIHESAGLQKTREDGCPRVSDCQQKYDVGTEWNPDCQGSNRPTGIGYFGRGYLQLTWCSNYVAASRAIFKNSTVLKKNPEIVATNKNLAWEVSAWYWRERVHNTLFGNPQFGLTTKQINGQSEECQGNDKNKEKSQQRYKYYVKVFKNFKVSGDPNEAGCY